MDWQSLEAHFIEAGKQMPAPFGEDAVEWDYSRVSRALGLVGSPTFADMPHSGGAVYVSSELGWAEAATRFRGWAEAAGWRFAQVTAAPTAHLPDTALAQLAARLAHPDSLLLVRGAGARRARLRARPRSRGCSTPFTPGERWLIATGRVRRRCRTDMAIEGLVVFVEDAHQLTPAAMSQFLYYLDAHKAWKGRMLVLPAKIYFVFAVTPAQEAGFSEMLARFSIEGSLARGESEEGGGGAPLSTLTLDAEDEHLLSALLDAPFALAEGDVARIFGASAPARGAELARRGYLRRVELPGAVCFAPPRRPIEGLPQPAPRVRRAIAARYRQRARRGHEHVLFGAAALLSRMGDPVRALAALSSATAANAACIPPSLAAELDALWESAGPRMRCADWALRLAAQAHQRRYASARESAARLVAKPLRSQADLARTIVTLLSIGRTHTDQSIPPEIWSEFQCGPLDPALVDAAAILTELFARLRYLRIEDAVARHEVACRALKHSTFLERQYSSAHSSRRPDLPTLLSLLELRATAHEIAHYVESPAREIRFENQSDAHGTLRRGAVPAYVAAILAVVIIQTRRTLSRCTLGAQGFAWAIDHGHASGVPEDLPPQVGVAIQCIRMLRLTLYCRSISDDALVLYRPAREAPYASLVSILHLVTGDREWFSASTHLLFMPMPSQEEQTKLDAYGLLHLFYRLVAHGQFATAKQSLSLLMRIAHSSAHTLACVLQAQLFFCRITLQWQQIDAVRQQITSNAASLTPVLRGYLAHYGAATKELTAFRWDSAIESLRRAEAAVSPVPLASSSLLGTLARRDRLIAEALRDLKLSPKPPAARTPSAHEAIAHVLAAHRRIHCPGAGGGRHDGPPYCALDFALAAMEEHAHRCTTPNHDDVLTAILTLRSQCEGALHELGDSLPAAMLRCARRLYASVAEAAQAVSKRVISDVGTPELLGAALALVGLTVEGRQSKCVRPDSAWLRIYRLSDISAQPGLKSVVHDGFTWNDDPTLYWKVLSHVRTDAGTRGGGQAQIVMYGYSASRSSGTVRSEVTLSWEVVAHRGVAIALYLGRDGTHVHSYLTDRACAVVESGPRGATKDNHEHEIDGSSAAAQGIRKLVDIAARCELPVLLLGETGTGKEFVARRIHQMSRRGLKPLHVGDCAAAVDSLLESELFGHVRGAFTGAHRAHDGLFERAHGGTLFLDEISSMSPRMQAALLRVLESGEYRPVGGDTVKYSDVRLICAGHATLRQAIASNAFRQDLYYRISTLIIDLPPLRERGDDAVELAAKYVGRKGCVLSAAALRVVRDYWWPGNIRQLRHCLDVSLVMNSGRVLGAEVVSNAIGELSQSGHTVKGGAGSEPRERRAWLRALPRLRELESFDAWEFARAVNTSLRSAQRHLASLYRQGVIERLGAGRGTRYVISSAANDTGAQ
ncbi:MAG: sigma 54-interacting transcriptional regulator [Planctomycetaceae bacterium]